MSILKLLLTFKHSFCLTLVMMNVPNKRVFFDASIVKLSLLFSELCLCTEWEAGAVMHL